MDTKIMLKIKAKFIDLKIVGYIHIAQGILTILFSFLALLGTSPQVIDIDVFFRLYNISSLTEYGIYGILIGLLLLTCGLGILRQVEFMWYLTLFVTLYALTEMCFSGEYKFFTLFFNTIIVAWLFWRRKLFVKEKTAGDSRV